MSQWNNGYTYNNQYQDPSIWNGDPNGQYVPQNTYYLNRQYDASNQYISFNEFLSQMQGNNVAQASGSNFNNLAYHNYAVNQYNNYSGAPSNSQVTPQLETYNIAQSSTLNIPNGTQVYCAAENQQHVGLLSESNDIKSDVAIKSNLTPTATEFVPKGSVNKLSSQNVNLSENTKSEYSESSESAVSNSVYNDRGNRSHYSNTNWRERPSSSSQPSESLKENNRNYYRNHEPSPRRYQESTHRSNEPISKGQETNYRNYESNTKKQDSSYRNQEAHSKSNDTRNTDSKILSKNKSKIKDSDSGRTFYNSSTSKPSQDVRTGRGEGPSSRNRNWVGSQRLRTDRNYPDDEQFANNYLQYKEEKCEKQPKVQQEYSSPTKSRNKFLPSDQGGDNNTDLTQRERLSQQLDKGTLECLVCCERVKQVDTVWACSNCYHVLHLRCIRKWAMSSLLEGKWRCPACQNTNEVIPTEYRCMCGAVRNPEWQRGSSGAHTCGKTCKRTRSCPHPCTLLCHPGPCPPCQATVNKQCGCGAETRSVLCSSKLPQVCGSVCKRTLNCHVHKCAKDCHEGPCDDCTESIDQVCYCPASKSRSVPCTAETATEKNWSCGDGCARVLSCGAHVCRAACHAPPCQPCALGPNRVHTCPCGKMKLEKGKRKLCTDPIPLCGNICAKPLSCGPAGDKHFCKLECHEGPCPVCPDKTLLQCRCGHSSREVLCADLPEMLNNIFCQKKCNKKLSCGRHRCRELCCAAETHRCPATCGRTLSCQTHRCEDFCHTGHCAPCPQVSFEELRCECGAEVVLPPVRCGARPPACSAPCRRPRPCGHPPHHTCHTGECPPCVVLTAKRCYGLHEERKTIPCSQEEFSCGLPCGKPLSCGKHTCIKTCHKGPCDTSKCTQPCMEKRPSCGHACAAACHVASSSTCPSTSPCRAPVTAACPCSRRTMQRTCAENTALHNKMLSAMAATKMQDGGSVDLSELNRPGSNLKTLECDDECRVEQRTQRMALALQIRNPDMSAKLAPRYSEHVRQWAQRDAPFARHVHEKLTDLVQLAKKSKQKTRSHSFPSMNWQKRQFIHELCEHFGCESVAYDAEPNRNVVATADKEKSWLPAMSVLEVLAREAGKRRVPGPVLRPNAPAATSSGSSKSGTGWATLTSTNAWAARSQPKPAVSEPKIDYFDNPPE